MRVSLENTSSNFRSLGKIVKSGAKFNKPISQIFGLVLNGNYWKKQAKPFGRDLTINARREPIPQVKYMVGCWSSQPHKLSTLLDVDNLGIGN